MGTCWDNNAQKSTSPISYNLIHLYGGSDGNTYPMIKDYFFALLGSEIRYPKISPNKGD